MSRTAASLLIGAALLSPSSALAASSSPALQGPWLLGAILSLYVLLRALDALLGQRVGWRFGPELLLVGLVLGPGTGLIQPDALDELATSSCAAIGLLLGLRINLLQLASIERQSLRASLIHAAILSSLLLALWFAAAPLIAWLGLMPLSPAILPPLAALIIASDNATLDALAARLNVSGEPVVLVRRIAQSSAILAILLHAVGPAASLPPIASIPLPPSLTWSLATLASGAACGLIALLLVRTELTRGQAAAALLGVLLLAAALAHTLSLSALAIGLIAGLLLSLTRAPSALPELLSGELDRALSSLLFFYLGAHWTFGASLSSLLLIPAFILVRALLRALSLTVAARFSPAARLLPSPAAALWSLGGVGVAILIELLRCWPPHALYLHELYTCAAFSILAIELSARSRARRWLLDVRATSLPRR